MGAILCDRAGAASLRIKVLALPLVAVRPRVAVGLAPVEVTYPELLFHCEMEEVAKLDTVRPVEVVRYVPLFAH